MRGRVLILIGAIILLGVLAAVLFVFNGDGGDDDTGGTAEPVIVEPGDDVGEGGDGQEVASGQGQTPSQTIDMVPIVVAVQYLARGREIPAPDPQGGPAVMVQPWPRQALVPPIEQNYFTDENDVIGKIARTDIFRGQPILRQHVVDNLAEIAKTGSDAAAILSVLPDDQEWVAVSIPIDLSGIGQVAFGIQDGDYVDIILSFLFIDVDEQFQTRLPNTISVITLLETGELSIGAPRQGRVATDSLLSGEGVLLGPSEQSQRPRLVTQMIVQNAFVVHVGYFPPDGRFIGPTPTPMGGVAPIVSSAGTDSETPSPTATSYVPEIITLGVTPQDALVLAWAVDAQLPITLALREANDRNQRLLAQPGAAVTDPGLKPVTLGYMVNAYNLPDPPDALAFALEPPITSVRRFDLLTLFDFLGEAVSGEEF